MYLLSKDESSSDPLPTNLAPISQSFAESAEIQSILKVSDHGLSDYGLKTVLGESLSSPNSLMVTEDSYATLVMGFPELEFSDNEVIEMALGYQIII